jgi:Ca2+/Na+ antiporter
MLGRILLEQVDKAGVDMLVMGAYIASIIILKYYDKEHPWRPIELPELKIDRPHGGITNPFRSRSKQSLVVYSIVAAFIVVVCGLLLVNVAQTLADQTGLGSSFVGITPLAASTSLPELSTTIAAVRMGPIRWQFPIFLEAIWLWFLSCYLRIFSIVRDQYSGRLMTLQHCPYW